MSEPHDSDSKVVLPEQPPGVGPGFLSSYWTSQTALPRMNSWELAQYFIGRGIENVSAVPLSSGITIGTVAIALFILGGFLLILQNIDAALSQSGGRYEVIAYLEEGIDADILQTFLSETAARPSVENLRYVSKEQALEEFKAELGDNKALIDGLAGVNPLPASIEVQIAGEGGAQAHADQLVNDLRNSNLVSEVSFVSEWIEQSQKVLKVFRMVGLTALLAVLAIILLLISNTIRLVMYIRRHEIGIMLLVGASDDSIRIPFMIGGLIQGLVGSILGLGFLRMAFLVIRAQLRDAPVLGAALPEVFFLSGFTVGAVLLLGAGMGCLGSMFALRKFMKV